MSNTTKLNRRDLKVSAQHLRAIQERRRSAASGSHDSRPRRARTRATARLAAIREAS